MAHQIDDWRPAARHGERIAGYAAIVSEPNTTDTLATPHTGNHPAVNNRNTATIGSRVLARVDDHFHMNAMGLHIARRAVA